MTRIQFVRHTYTFARLARILQPLVVSNVALRRLRIAE